jgi:hypothetical protein
VIVVESVYETGENVVVVSSFCFFDAGHDCDFKSHPKLLLLLLLLLLFFIVKKPTHGLK